jgi:hypothetical protein
VSESLARLAVDLTANVAGFESDLGRANRMAEKFSRQVEKDLGKIGAAIAANMTVAFAVVAAGAKKAINDLDRIGDVSARIGVGVKALQELGYAAAQSGTNAETLEKGLAKLSRTMAESAAGGAAQKALFTALGVAATDATGKLRPVEEVFVDLSEKFRQYKGGAGEVKIATELFGKAGADLIPVLNEGRAGLRGFADEAANFGVVVGEDAVAQAQAFNDNLDKLQTILKGVFNDVAKDLLPALVSLSGLFVDNGTAARKAGEDFSILPYVIKGVIISGIAVKNIIESITDVLAFGVDIIMANIEVWKAFGNVLSTVAGAQAKALQGDFQGAWETMQKGSTETAQITSEAFAKLRGGWEALKSGFQNSGSDIADAIERIYNPIEKLGEEAKKAGEDVGTVEAPIVDTGNAAGKTEPKIKKLKDTTAQAAREAEEWRERLRDLAAEIEGPVAQANVELDRQLDELGDAYGRGAISAEQFAEAKKNLIEAHKREIGQIKTARTPMEQLLEDLEFEIQLLGMSNEEREKAIALRGLEADATEEQKRQLENLLNQRQFLENSKAQAAEWTAIWQDAFGQVAQSLLAAFANGDGIGDALKNSLQGALNGVLDKNIKKFTDALGQWFSGGGTGGLTARGANGMPNWANGALALGAGLTQGWIGSENTAQSAFGGAANGAALGTQFGGVPGAIIGSILGAIVGAISSQKPYLEVSSSASNINRGRVEGTATSQLGRIFVGKDDLTLPGNMSSQQLADNIAKFDNAIATMLNSSELQAAQAALSRFDVNQSGSGAIDTEEILSQRFNAVIRAIEPQWAAFLGRIDDLQERVKALEGLRVLSDWVEDFGDVIDGLDPDPLRQLQNQLHNLDKAVTDTADQLAAAIDAQDPAAILEAANAAQQAVTRRYQAEVDGVRNLQAAIAQLDEQARAFRTNIAQRLLDVGGLSIGQLASSQFADIGAARGSVLNAADTQTALANLDRFVASVDAWLQSARAEVDAWAAQSRARVQAALAALDTEQNSIMAAAQARMAQQQAAAQQFAAQQQAAQQAQLQALQQQLAVAQQWAGVLQSAQRMLDQMATGAANPLSGFSRLALLDERIAQLRGNLSGATGANRATIAQELLAALNERLQLAQGQFQRPSPEYMAIFNATVRETAGLRDIAQQEADRAAELQELIASLQQQTVDAVGGLGDVMSYLSTDEAERLTAIEAERTALQNELIEIDREAQRRLDEINATARAQYEWAQTTFEELNAVRHAELIAQLEAITGGLDPDSFIAQRMAETTDLLTDIRDGIAEFLGSISAGGGNGGTSPAPIEPGMPRDPDNPSQPYVPAGTSNVITMPLAIDLNLEGGKLARYVVDVVVDKAGLVAPAMKRAARTA